MSRVLLLCLLLVISLHCLHCQIIQAVGDLFYRKETIVKHINILCYKKSFNDFHTYGLENIDSLPHDSAVFNPECETILFVPGWTQTLVAKTTIPLLTSYFKIKHKCPNICQFNYTKYAQQTPHKAFLAVNAVGEALSMLTKKLFNNGVDRNKFSCMGHSLGAQVCGALGRYTNPKIQSIVALDAAGPGFHFMLKGVAKGQAQCVECVRTDAGFYGVATGDCDIDVYPNGGTRYQPGCPELIKDFCSHHRSTNYTASAILHPDLFLTVKCDLTDSGVKCDDKNPIKLTELLPKCLHEKLHGNFFFRTSGKEPYGLGMEGAKKETFTFFDKVFRR